jgi:hypothetical protein
LKALQAGEKVILTDIGEKYTREEIRVREVSDIGPPAPLKGG